MNSSRKQFSELGRRGAQWHQYVLVLALMLVTSCEAKVNSFFTPPTYSPAQFAGAVAGVVMLNGKPAGGIPVGAGLVTGTTAADGSYKIDGLLPGNVNVSIGGMPANSICTPGLTVVVSISTGVTAKQDFACISPTVGSVSGTITLNNVPVAGILVTAGGRSATSNSQGIYRIDSLPAGLTSVTALPILVPTVSCVPPSQNVTIVLGAVAPANFVCTQPTTGTITGTFTVNGTPTQGVVITITGGATSTTNASGVFRFDNVAPALVTVAAVELPPAVTCTPNSRAVAVVAGGLHVTDFPCTRPTVGSVSGTVTVNGAPVGGILVTSGTRSSVTNSFGIYRIDSLPLGAAIVNVLPIIQIPVVTCVPNSKGTTIVVTAVATVDFSCSTSFTINITPTYRHLGIGSEVCTVVTTVPAQPNAPYTGTITGPGALTSTLSGILSATGTVMLRFGIGLIGNYSGNVSIAGQNASFTIGVMTAAGTCAP